MYKTYYNIPTKQLIPTLRSVQDGCPPNKIYEHVKAHLNPDDPSVNFEPEELDANLPSFIEELEPKYISCK